MCVYWNNYVATLTIVLLYCFCAASSNLCRDSISVGSSCNNVFCIVSIFFTTKKVCHDRVLSPLNLISCCNFISMLRRSLLVLYMFSLMTQFVMSRKDILYSTNFSVTTQFFMSGQDFSSLCGNPCRDIEKSVVTLFICVQFIYVLRP